MKKALDFCTRQYIHERLLQKICVRLSEKINITSEDD